MKKKTTPWENAKYALISSYPRTVTDIPDTKIDFYTDEEYEKLAKDYIFHTVPTHPNQMIREAILLSVNIVPDERVRNLVANQLEKHNQLAAKKIEIKERAELQRLKRKYESKTSI